MKNIAIVAPKLGAYSETFIKAHKEKLNGNIKFYYGGSPPNKLEGRGFLKDSFINEIAYKWKYLKRKNPDELYSARFKASLIKNRIDIVLCEYGTTAVNIYEICESLKIPLIVHFHGGDATVHSVIEENKNAYKKVFKSAFAIVVVSTVMKAKLINLGAPRDKIVLNTYGPNPLFHNINASLNNKTFVGIGRFVDKKAPYYTIIAFSKVLKKHPDAKLIMAGNGPLLNACRNLSNYLNVDKNIEFPGVISPIDFIELLKNSRAYVQHSITADNGDMEGTPLAVLEASAAGLPVISTFHAGIPDVIEHEKTGLLVEEHDVDGMATNMVKILNDLELAKKMGHNGKIRIKNNFPLDKHLHTLDQLINTAT